MSEPLGATLRPGVGVTVGRFQVDELHEGHRALIEECLRHGKTLVCVGCSKRALVSRQNPLDYPTRERMIRAAYPDVQVTPLHDEPTDDGWSRALDRIVGTIYPTDTATLYAGRDSFRPHYSGIHPVREVDTLRFVSGTDVRERVGARVGSTAEFRRGAIYAACNQWARINPCVDVAITKPHPEDGFFVLLGKRDNEPGLLRFPGGHIDPSDESGESAAIREAREETGVELGETVSYVCQIPMKPADKATSYLTTLYQVEYRWGAAQGKDDLDGAEWCWSKQLHHARFADYHDRLATALVAFMERRSQ